MKKAFIILLSICFFFGASFSVKATSEEYRTINYLRGIKDYEFKNKPFTDKNAAIEHQIYMMPLRETMEILGYKVKWNNNGKINMEKGFLRASLVVGSDNYTNRYDQRIRIYQVPIYVDGVTYVPHTFFSQVLDYDCYPYKDSFYLRTKIENILSRTYEVNDDYLVGKKVEIIYPEITINDNKYRPCNEEIKNKVDEYVKDLLYDELYLKYDIGVYDKNIISIIFTGEYVKGGKTYPIFDSLNYHFKVGKAIAITDIFKNGSSYESFILSSLLKGVEDKDKVMFSDLKMYFVNNAMIIYKNSQDKAPNISHFYSAEEISDFIKTDYQVFN